jgi:isoamylase
VTIAGIIPRSASPIAPAETNGRFRDDVRDFLRGGPGAVRRLADRLVGSPEIQGEGREAESSVNLVTCHKGFTLKRVRPESRAATSGPRVNRGGTSVEAVGTNH